MTCLEKLAPKSFLGHFSLQNGCKIIGIFMACVAIISAIAIGVELYLYGKCVNCTSLILHNAYSFSINALIYSILVIFINIWFIWGVYKGKSSVVLCWVVLTLMWWVQSFCLVLVFLFYYISQNIIVWFVLLALAIVAYIIFAYFILVAYGYWLQLWKNKPNTQTGQAA